MSEYKQLRLFVSNKIEIYCACNPDITIGVDYIQIRRGLDIDSAGAVAPALFLQKKRPAREGNGDRSYHIQVRQPDGCTLELRNVVD